MRGYWILDQTFKYKVIYIKIQITKNGWILKRRSFKISESLLKKKDMRP